MKSSIILCDCFLCEANRIKRPNKFLLSHDEVEFEQTKREIEEQNKRLSRINNKE